MGERSDERERAERDAVGLAREHREQLLGPRIAAFGGAVAVRHDHGVEAGPLGLQALLDHRVHRVGDRVAFARGVIRVDQIADPHGCSGGLYLTNRLVYLLPSPGIDRSRRARG